MITRLIAACIACAVFAAPAAADPQAGDPAAARQVKAEFLHAVTFNTEAHPLMRVWENRGEGAAAGN